MATGRIGTTPVLTTRWSKAPAAGTTSLSGLDDNSVSLVYSVGYEQVYLNGALLSRTNDYTATNGTTITLTNATVAGDIVEVFANAVVPLTDTYTQSVANGKFINNTLTTTTGDIIYASAANTPARLGIGSTDQVLKVSGGLPVWGAGGLPNATSYTPTTTNWTLGNGSMTTYYVSSGDTVFYYGRILWGSTTSNTGQMRISLPFTAANFASNTYLISASGAFFDASTGTAYQLICTGPSTTAMGFNVIGSNSTYVSGWAPIDSATPVAPTTNDEILFFSYYRKA